ncbi:hypothetical protein NL676_022622 [Syzygium grande]|nr:hypothetical protein NL676_022622 [Syzygium grande]
MNSDLPHVSRSRKSRGFSADRQIPAALPGAFYPNAPAPPPSRSTGGPKGKQRAQAGSNAPQAEPRSDLGRQLSKVRDFEARTPNPKSPSFEGSGQKENLRLVGASPPAPAGCRTERGEEKVGSSHAGTRMERMKE